ncbi:MAG TPA: MmgE/PrpD family protein [Beijerinckiaceae bacterium]|jgi:2-methylcitrate dehydratase PrpD
MAEASAAVEYGVAPLRLNIGRDFCAFLATFSYADLPEQVVHESRRGVLDWIGCALAGSRHPKLRRALAGLKALGSAERARVLAHDLRLGLLEAAIVNGQMGHILDYDDTHMDGVVLHTSSPVLAALLAVAETGPFSGRDLICAYAAGFEGGVRVGKASPGHHDGGWHLTGTLGSIAAGVAVARLLRLDPAQTTHALGIAATQAAGMQQNRGTMCKSFHAGKAASNGVLAGFLAREGVDSSDEIIEGRRGFSRTYSAGSKPEALLERLGEDWQILRNGYKPYACGVVVHPLIDGMIALRRRGIDPARVLGIEIAVNEAAVRITGVQEPQTGLQSKFSIYHSAAVSFLDGDAGIAQYSDERALADEVVQLRRKVRISVHERFRRDEAHVVVIDADGTRHEAHVDHATGTVDNPMPDEAIRQKFLANAEPAVGAGRARDIAECVLALEAVEDVRDLVRLCA